MRVHPFTQKARGLSMMLAAVAEQSKTCEAGEAIQYDAGAHPAMLEAIGDFLTEFARVKVVASGK